MEQDIILVRNVLKGDAKSFEYIVNKYEFSILKFVYNMIRNKEEAEDITQEVFLTVYNKMYLYNEKYKFYNWIVQIAKNKCIDYIRKYKKVYNVDITKQKRIKSKEISPQEFIEYKETKQLINDIISDLDIIDKQIIVLKCSQKMTFKDISDILNISQSTIKRRYYKTKNYIMDILEERCK